MADGISASIAMIIQEEENIRATSQLWADNKVGEAMDNSKEEGLDEDSVDPTDVDSAEVTSVVEAEEEDTDLEDDLQVEVMAITTNSIE